MVISIKDGIKLFGVSIVCFCAVFVCTFFLNFYADAIKLADSVLPAQQPLYDAQIATAQLVCAIAGGVLGLIAVMMTVFYIKLFIDGNAKRFAILKAMGYSDWKIARGFWVFGLSVLVGTAVGCACGYVAMPLVYDGLAVDGLAIEIGFHAWLPVALAVAPTVLFGALSCFCAKLSLRKNICAMMKGAAINTRKIRVAKKERSFMLDMCIGVLRSRKSTVFFALLSCFCFSAMLQMGFAMRTLSSVTMGAIILAIGIIIAVTTLIMAVTTVINSNAENIAVMKAFGYSSAQRVFAVLIGYLPFAFLGFGLGTAYQYGLLMLMTKLVFADVAGMPEYSFDVPMFFVTLAAFIAAYGLAVLFYARRINNISVKKIMSDE